jgi:phosphoenolpyruvate synthase/pyruvate phosphate dikinase
VDQELVLDLGCVGARLLPEVGGKAANLGELIRAGFPVPPGFCITTAAYQQVAGVLFTADPVTGHRGHTVIDANPGLGEAVVSGAVNPDHFVVDATGAVLERRLGDKRVLVRSLPSGGTEQLARSADAEQSCLSDGQIRDLTAWGSASRSTTAPRRTSSGRWTPMGRCG